MLCAKTDIFRLHFVIPDSAAGLLCYWRNLAEKVVCFGEKHSNVLFACSPDDINPSVVMESNKIQLMESQTIDQGGDIGIYDLEYVHLSELPRGG